MAYSITSSARLSFLRCSGFNLPLSPHHFTIYPNSQWMNLFGAPIYGQLTSVFRRAPLSILDWDWDHR